MQNNKSLWQAYRSINPRTRVWIGVGGMIIATVGMGLSDYLEKKYPATEREREQAELLSPVTVVDRHPDSKNA
ncbi:hypothetical protein BCR43DRAFT_490553 [Syncephalastrum racemosum]|uniref:Uncharacterized protein n=1 Tax=Syncephalastrum racemosum TaxID=13706 RepID=A0A1X2HG74_SYNRA|nr:hypothetical protein BCR43DRAFT_490553 [Syncephalastrum racemosum]